MPYLRCGPLGGAAEGHGVLHSEPDLRFRVLGFKGQEIGVRGLGFGV